ncbi:LacI family DNA-binding transcriptional regulator [Lacrimispora sp. 210928-DFI.3.58]|uniref:LacI family DNA-binding transcriptional regulator n=1 Tax=Lacrimispora sp. 210928-DFI.3.58 TaxID=2883214 RepID=UPI0015B72EF5|nr:LacI family DNA-binding transcriptional regulator [Lacrimispora sp. 210928-DFI.3.58]MCB7319251.1 LacI family transcriptional regulator [Lacrimispora sp. 210928-DFI.3.58]
MNIYDIAKEAGVSISTVSRVMNNKGNVNPATREKVEEILARNSYVPSAIARGMMSKSLNKVAVLTVDIRVPHYARTAYTIEREFSRRGYEVSLCNTGGELQETVKYLRAALEKQVDGIVLVGSVFNTICRDPEIEGLLRTTPTVLANGKLELPNSYSVLVDDKYGIGLAVDHLVRKGHREIYYLKDMDTVSARLKCEGFLNSLGRYGIKDAKKRVVNTAMSIEGGMKAVEQLLRKGNTFTAVVCGEDVTAAGAVKALLHAGLRVPEDVAVTGYNNSEYARICEPRLTTIDNKPELVAMLCVQLLTSLIEKTEAYSSCTIQPELVEGQTT